LDVVGSDISLDVVRAKKSQFGSDRFYVPTEIPTEVKFDGIVAVEVFEHFAEPRNTFSLIFNRLNIGGVICGTTDFYKGQEIADGNTPGYMSLRGHIAYWSSKSMSRISEEFGYAVAEFEMIRPGIVLPDEKYGQLYPNKRVFFIYDPEIHKGFFDKLMEDSPILPIDKP
jgi:hypothetical protein